MFENRKLQGWLLTSVIAILVIVALKVRVGLTPQSAPLDGRHARAEAAASEIEQSPGALDERVGRDPFAAEVCPEREIAEAGAHTERRTEHSESDVSMPRMVVRSKGSRFMFGALAFLHAI